MLTKLKITVDKEGLEKMAKGDKEFLITFFAYFRRNLEKEKEKQDKKKAKKATIKEKKVELQDLGNKDDYYNEIIEKKEWQIEALKEEVKQLENHLRAVESDEKEAFKRVSKMAHFLRQKKIIN